MKTAIVLCEESQTVMIALRQQGIEAYSCDIIDCSGGYPEYHFKEDAIKMLYDRKWDYVIAHPPCTRLCNSGVRWLVSLKEREGYEWSEHAKIFVRSDKQIWEDFYAACRFFNQFILYGKTGGKIRIENPIQHKYAVEEITARPSQIIQPWQYGHPEMKATCIWNFNIQDLVGTYNVYDEMMKVPYGERAKTHYASPGPDRGKIRSKTYPGIAHAIATQLN